jgi:hypothetical protein
VATAAGHEKRNVNWAQARGRWDVASGLKKQPQMQYDTAGMLGNGSWGHRVTGFWVPPCRYRADGRAICRRN